MSVERHVLYIHGLRDVEVYFLNTAVSIRERGEWIAHLDVLVHMEPCVAFIQRPPTPRTHIMRVSSVCSPRT